MIEPDGWQVASVASVAPQAPANDPWAVESQLTSDDIESQHAAIDKLEAGGMPQDAADKWREKLPERSGWQVAKQIAIGSAVAAGKATAELARVPGALADLGQLAGPVPAVARSTAKTLDYLRGDTRASDAVGKAFPLPTQTELYKNIVGKTLEHVQQGYDALEPSLLQAEGARKARHTAEVEKMEAGAPWAERMAAQAFAGIENQVRNPAGILPAATAQVPTLLAATTAGPELLGARASAAESEALLAKAAEAQAKGDAELAKTLSAKAAKAQKTAASKAKVGTAAGFGAETAQGAADQAEQQFRGLSDADKRRQSPRYARARDGGASEADATTAVASDIRRIALGLGAAIGTAGGLLIPGQEAGKLAAAGGLEASMTVQGAASQGAANVAQKASGAKPDQSLSEGVPEAAGQAAVSALPVALGAGALHGKAKPGVKNAAGAAPKPEPKPGLADLEREDLPRSAKDLIDAQGHEHAEAAPPARAAEPEAELSPQRQELQTRVASLRAQKDTAPASVHPHLDGRIEALQKQDKALAEQEAKAAADKAKAEEDARVAAAAVVQHRQTAQDLRNTAESLHPDDKVELLKQADAHEAEAEKLAPKSDEAVKRPRSVSKVETVAPEAEKPAAKEPSAAKLLDGTYLAADGQTILGGKPPEGTPEPVAKPNPRVDRSGHVGLTGGIDRSDPGKVHIDARMPHFVWAPDHEGPQGHSAGHWQDVDAEIVAHEDGENTPADNQNRKGYPQAHVGEGNAATRAHLVGSNTDPVVYGNIVRPYTERIEAATDPARVPKTLDQRPYRAADGQPDKTHLLHPQAEAQAAAEVPPRPALSRPTDVAAQHRLRDAAARVAAGDDRHFVDEYAKPTDAVVAVLKQAGIDAGGYSHAVDDSAIRHILKQHGDPKAEAARGQEAITPDDIAKLPQIVAAPDQVEPGAATHQGLPTLRYSKRFNGHIITVEEARRGRKRLSLVTMWKTRHAPDAPSSPKSPAQTSETFGRNLPHADETIARTQAGDRNAADQEGRQDQARDGQGVRPEEGQAGVLRQPQQRQDQGRGQEAPVTPAKAAAPEPHKGILPMAHPELAGQAGKLRAMAAGAGWAEKGTRDVDAAGADVETPWVPKQPWFKDVQGSDSKARLKGNTEGEATREAVRKAQAGEPMTREERRHVKAMLDWGKPEAASEVTDLGYNRPDAIREEAAAAQGHAGTRDAVPAGQAAKPVRTEGQQPDRSDQLGLDGGERNADVGAAAGQQDLLKPEAPKPAVTPNKFFTEDAAAAARARLRAKLHTPMTGVDPEMLVDGITLAGYHIEKGARTFAAYAKAMLEDLGEQAKPYLKSWYMAAKFDPRSASFAHELSPEDEVARHDLAAPIEKRPEAAQTQSLEGRGNVSEEVRPGGDRSLAAVPAEPVRSAESERNAGRGGGSGGREDTGRAEGADAAGLEPPAGLGTGEGALPVPAAGREPQRGPGRAGEAAERAKPELEHQPEPVKRATAPAANFTITPELQLGRGGIGVKYQDNIAAIKLLKQLESEQRDATPEEQQVLARYVGWGGMKAVFLRSDGSTSKGWEDRARELRALLSDGEHATAMRSLLDAHYTSQTVVKGVWDALRRLGFEQGRVLEPSVGIGNFFGLMPEDLRAGSHLHGVELDGITARIAKKLYPKAAIEQTSFEHFVSPDDRFDVVVGNPPFGSNTIRDASRPQHSGKSIHNYFFGKSLDLLRPNGVMAMVVSRFMLDKLDTADRKALTDQTRLLGAIRLPNTAFKQNANAEVTTDIVFLQKRVPGDASHGESWTATQKVPDPLGGPPMDLNEYFVRHPEMMLGRMQRSGQMRGAKEPTLAPHADGDLESQLRDAIARLPAEVLPRPEAPDLQAHLDEALQQLKPRDDEIAQLEQDQFRVKDGAIEQRVEDVDGAPTVARITPQTQWTAKQKLGEERYRRLASLVALRDTLRRQIELESGQAEDASVESNRKTLRQQYQAYVAEHGFINGRSSDVIKEDPYYPLLLALESKYDEGVSPDRARSTGLAPRKPSAEPAAILSQRAIPRQEVLEHADTPKDALIIALSQLGKVDLGHMAKLAGKSIREVVQDLHDDRENPLIYHDPETQQWQPANQYLSGNIREKIQAAKAAGLDKNVEQLTKVIPEDAPPSRISVRMGAVWVPPEDYLAFAKSLLGEDTGGSIRYHALGNKFTAELVPRNRANETAVYGTERMPASDIISRLLNNEPVKVFDRVPDGTGGYRQVLNENQTERARIKAEDIAERFKQWIFADPDRRARLVRLYNDTNNNLLPTQYDGSHLSLPGKVPDAFIKMRPHQNNAVWRTIQQPYTLLDHVVGSGKTFTIVASAMELRRMGLAKKPMVAVPNHLVEQWAADFLRLYPGARILAASKKDFEKGRRQKLFSRIATGNWDAVIVGHSSFGRITLSPEVETQFLNEEIGHYQSAIDDERKQVGQGVRNVADLVRATETMKGRLKALATRARDNLLSFDQLGVDQLFVDEAHEFKNLNYASRLQGVLGLGDKSGSKKALDLQMKLKAFRELGLGRGAVFATGTPISNSLAEMYHLQRYLMPEALQRMGIEHFDAWQRQFAEAKTEYELNAAGKLVERTRLNKFDNVPSLMAIYRSMADSVDQDDLNQAHLEQTGKPFPIPKVEGGKRLGRLVPPTPGTMQLLASLVQRVDDLPTITDRDARNAERLRIMTTARKLAIDPRVVNPHFPDEPGSKLHQTADDVARIYHDNTPRKGTQLVFLDMSVPKIGVEKELKEIRKLRADSESPDEEVREAALEKLGRYSPDELDAIESAGAGGFSAYEDLKKKLVERGVPAQQIRFIQEANTDLQKQQLFDSVKAGDVRVLLGSTSKMGAGTNVQDRLVGLHHIDVPYRPSDIEQREGRIIRQGNLFYQDDPDFAVKIHAYLAERTADSPSWNMQEAKLRMINQVRKYKGEWEIQDEDSGVDSATELKALASGDQRIFEHAGLSRDIRKLENEQSSFQSGQYHAQDALKTARDKLARYQPQLADADRDAAAVNDVQQAQRDAARGRTVTVGDRTFSNTDAAAVSAAASHSEELIKAQKQDDENAKYQVQVNGKPLTSREAIRKAINESLGEADGWQLQLGDQTYTSRHAAAQALDKIGEELLKQSTATGQEAERPVGQYLGMPLSVFVDRDAKVRTVAGKQVNDISYGVRLSGTQELENATRGQAMLTAGRLRRDLEDLGEQVRGKPAQYRRIIADAEKNIPALQEQLAKTWPKGELLQAKRERFRELSQELSQTAKGPKPAPSPHLETHTGRPVGRFAELEGAHDSPRQAFDDAAALTGLHLNIPVEHGPADMDPQVPMRYNLDTRRIELNPDPKDPLDRATAAYMMAEELLHAVDHVGGRRTLSGGSPRLAMDGDLAQEAQRVFDAGGEWAQQLSYPLQWGKTLSDARMRAELFARLGTLYFADPETMKRLLPLAHGAFDEHFRLAHVSGQPDQYVRGKVWTGAPRFGAEVFDRRPDAAVRGGPEAGAGPQPADRLGELRGGPARGGFRLGELRSALARSFGTRASGTAVRLDDLKSTHAPPEAGRAGSGEGGQAAAEEQAAHLPEVLRDVTGSDLARRAANEFLNQPLTNLETGITATVSRSALDKMLSSSASQNSVSVAAHMKAVANVDHLLPVALLRQTRADRGGDANLKAIHHFEAPMPFGDQMLRVKMLLKEMQRSDQGTRVYTVSAVEIAKPASERGDSTVLADQARLPTPPAGFEERFARLAEAVKGRPGERAPDVLEHRTPGKTTAPEDEYSPDYEHGERITGIKHATVDEERAARGLPPLMSEARKGFEQSWDEAEQRMADDPSAAPDLVKELNARPQPIDDVQNAMLLRQRVNLHNAYHKAMALVNDAGSDEATVKEYSVRTAQIEDAINELDKALRVTGTAQGRGLSARRMMAREDYSLAAMMQAQRAAGGGRPLSPETRAAVQKLHQRIAELETELAGHEARADEAASKAQGQDVVEGLKGKVKAEDAQDQAADRKRAPKKDAGEIVKGMKKDYAAGRPLQDMGSYIQRLAEAFVRQGVDKLDPLVNLVHEALREHIDPEITRRQTMDAISGYGDFKPLNKEWAKAKLRDLKGQAQQLAKLQDIEAGRPPLKTGVERREPSDEERRLTKLVNEAKRRFGIVSTDPATQLKSALDAVKTRLRNQISDLDYQISTGKKFVDDKTQLLYDAEAAQLKEQRDALKQQFDQIFGTPEMTDEQRLARATKAVEDSIARYEKRIAEKDFSTRQSKTPESPELEALRARRAALREEHQTLKDADPLVQAAKVEAAEQQLRARIDELNRRIMAGDVSTPDKAEGPTSQALQELRAEADRLNQQLQALRREAMSPEEKNRIALQAYKARVKGQIAATLEKAARQDFAAKPRRPIILDEAGKALKAQYQQARNDFTRLKLQDRLARRTVSEKAQDAFNKWHRAFLLSSPVTLGKLTAAAMTRMLSAPLEEAIGAGIGKALPGLAAQAPREGGLNVEAEAKAAREGLVKYMKNARDYLASRGETEKAVLYGRGEDGGIREKDVAVHSVADWFGLLHGALKNPVKEAEFLRSYEKRVAWNIRQGVDTSDEAVQTRLAIESWKDANRSIFLQDNKVVDAYNSMLSALERPGKDGHADPGGKLLATGLRALLPIVRVPTNIVAETMEYALGSVSGGVKLALAMRKGIETLPPEKADLILRQLKKGSIGGALLLVGFLNPATIGGYYQPGEKRSDKDVKAGRLRLYGVDLPTWLLHSPLLETLQIGATIRRVSQQRISKKHPQAKGMGEGIEAGALGLTEEVPFVREMLDLGALKDDKSHAFLGELAKSIVVPQALQYVARQMDQDKPWPSWSAETVSRKPQTFAQHIETGIPVLRQQVPRRKGARAPAHDYARQWLDPPTGTP